MPLTCTYAAVVTTTGTTTPKSITFPPIIVERTTTMTRTRSNYEQPRPGPELIYTPPGLSPDSMRGLSSAEIGARLSAAAQERAENDRHYRASQLHARVASSALASTPSEPISGPGKADRPTDNTPAPSDRQRVNPRAGKGDLVIDTRPRAAREADHELTEDDARIIMRLLNDSPHRQLSDLGYASNDRGERVRRVRAGADRPVEPDRRAVRDLWLRF